jgi:hypothetical protein
MQKNKTLSEKNSIKAKGLVRTLGPELKIEKKKKI